MILLDKLHPDQREAHSAPRPPRWISWRGPWDRKLIQNEGMENAFTTFSLFVKEIVITKMIQRDSLKKVESVDVGWI